jgi:hypothetical protein
MCGDILYNSDTNYKILSIIHSIFQTREEIFGARLCSSDKP